MLTENVVQQRHQGAHRKDGREPPGHLPRVHFHLRDPAHRRRNGDVVSQPQAQQMVVAINFAPSGFWLALLDSSRSVEGSIRWFPVVALQGVPTE